MTWWTSELQENARICVNLRTKEGPWWERLWNSLWNVLSKRELTSNVCFVGVVPDGQSQKSEEYAVTQAHWIPTHLCLLSVQKIWQLWLLHFCFPNLMHLPPVVTFTSEPQTKDNGIQFTTSPKLMTLFMETSGHQLLSSFHKVSTHSMHRVQFPTKIKDNEQRQNY